ncbi:hypothetical protein FXW78_21345 [Rhodococcus opacus]|nr:hypothetical protein [Rhodococcus opacus]
MSPPDLPSARANSAASPTHRPLNSLPPEYRHDRPTDCPDHRRSRCARSQSSNSRRHTGTGPRHTDVLPHSRTDRPPDLPACNTWSSSQYLGDSRTLRRPCGRTVSLRFSGQNHRSGGRRRTVHAAVQKVRSLALRSAAGTPATLDQVEAAAEDAGFTLEAGDVAIVDFGYDKYLPGHSDEREPGWWGRNEPGLSDEVCAYLAAAQVVAVASDTSACDLAVADGEMSAGSGHGHHFLPQGILIVECLRGLGQVPPTGLIAALPLKLTGGTGSPLRVLLLTD